MDFITDESESPTHARNVSPVIPRGSIAGRSLFVVVAIMTFLATLTSGAVLLVRAAASDWQSEIAREVTIQVRQQAGRDIERDVVQAVALARATSGVTDVRPYSKGESAELLEPWLGSGLKLDDLPVPRMIVVRIAPGAGPDLDDLRQRLAAGVPSALLDDHRAWVGRMRTMTRLTVLGGLVILAMVILVTIISVSFATRGAMAANRPIVEVLHFVGAGDRFIANRFLHHFLWLGLEGGLVGCVAAILIFAFAETIGAFFSGTPVGDQIAALLGSFSLGPIGYLALIAQAIMIAGITAWASRRTLYATLESSE